MKLIFSYSSFKRFNDIFFSLFLLIIFFPFLLFVSLLILSKLGKPVFFRQQRAGYSGHPFMLLKFRTMTNDCDSTGKLLPNQDRITPLGLWLRNTSIDELPELVNILRGDMSFIGPRPLLTQYLPLYSSEQARRHEVKPGFSGWAQINGRNAISWNKRLYYDVWYVDNIGFLLDLKIIFLTVIKVILRRDITTVSGDFMPVFKGNHSSPE